MQLSPEQQKQLDEQKAQCPMCKLASGEYPSTTVYEDDYLRAVMDIRPSREGHVLVIPKEHYPLIAFMPEEEFKHTFRVARDLARVFKKSLLSFGSNLFIASGGVAGQQFPHFVFHMIPRDKAGELPKFSIPSKALDAAKYDEVFKLMKHNLPQAMAKHAPQKATEEGKDQLAMLLDQNPQLKQMVIDNPSEVKKAIEQNPQLQQIFAGVDVDALSQALKSQQVETGKAPQPRPEPPVRTEHQSDDIQSAAMMTDKQLENFLNMKESLKSLLLEDLDTLADMTESNERLQRFFAETSIEEVSIRAKKIFNKDKSGGLEDTL